jgi:membrane fusion protein (multidrug efflux system)
LLHEQEANDGSRAPGPVSRASGSFAGAADVTGIRRVSARAARVKRSGGSPARSRRRRIVRAALIVTAIGVVALPKLWSTTALGRLLGQRPSLSEPPSGAVVLAPAALRRGAAPLLVTIEAVTPATLAETVSSSGTLLAIESVDLQAEVTGKITAIAFEEGARVRKGDLLVKLNDADLQARRLAIQHELALAERREQRIRELLSQGFVVPDDHDEAVSTVEVRRAEIALTDAQIAKTEIRAPFDGVAGLRYVSEGALVNATTRIATLQRIDMLKVDFAIPERYAARVRVGSPITFTVAGRAERFQGEVYAYDPRIDEGTRTLLIRAICPNSDGTLLPGAFANVELVLDELHDALLVPAEAVIPDYDTSYVYVVKEGRAEQRQVVTGVRTDSRVQILSGLEPGEVVVTSGLPDLRPGSEVRVLQDATDAPPWQSTAALR